MVKKAKKTQKQRMAEDGDYFTTIKLKATTKVRLEEYRQHYGSYEKVVIKLLDVFEKEMGIK